MKRTLIAALIATATLTAGAGSAETGMAVESELGPVLASSETGLTLYTFRNDSDNTSNCYDDCASAWPPFAAPASAQSEGALGVIERRDGSRQYALNGQPLYFWAGDAEKGDVTGDGVGGVWDAVRQ